MTKPTIAIHNIETNELIEREMNAAELKLHNQRNAESEELEVIAQTKAAEKQAILDRIGLTADELKTILG